MIKKVLLVDDDRSVREMFALGLRNAGFEISAVENGGLAVTALEQGVFDATIMDVMMPGMTGMDVLEVVSNKNLTENMGKLVVLSSLDRGLLQEKLDRYKVTLCFDKSELTPSELIKLLKQP